MRYFILAVLTSACNTNTPTSQYDSVDAAIASTKACTGALALPQIQADIFACVNTKLIVNISKPTSDAECFSICEDGWEAGFAIDESDAVAGAIFDLARPGTGFYAEVTGTPDESSPACFCGHADYKVQMGKLEIIDYDGETVCGTLSNFLPKASGTFVIPIAASCE